MPRMNPTPPKPSPERQRKALALAAHQARLDEMMPQLWLFGRDLAQCLECGVLVFNRTKHWNWHSKQIFKARIMPDRTQAFLETLVCLFGDEDAEA